MERTIRTIKNNFQNLLTKEKTISIELINSIEHLYEHLNDTMCDNLSLCNSCQEVKLI